MSCPLAGVCGGCSQIDIPYDQQVQFKNESLIKVISAIEPSAVIEDPVTGPQFGYRSRARFRYSKQGLSFFEEKTNTPVLLKSCPVLDEQMNSFLSNPPKLNIWELDDGQLSCFSTDKKVIYGTDMGWVTVKGKRLPVSGDVFFQSNLILLPKMIDYVVENVTGQNVMDLYSGIGTFSAFLEDTHNVTAVEINKKCLSMAKQHLKATKFFTSPVEKWNPKKTAVDTVIVDPPRVGLERNVPQMIASWQPQTIIYVSCYLPTQSRDLNRFKELGYSIKKARLFDFYPNTSHLETCVLLVREQYKDSKTASIKVDLDGVNIKQQKPLKEPKPTYDNIKKWVKENYSFEVSSLYIAQTKDKVGIKERENYNIGEGKGVVPKCPSEKEAAILEAFKHFKMI